MRDQAPAYLRLAPARADDKSLEAAIAHFTDKQRREEFFSFFKELERLYEIISPDAFLREHVEAYTRLADLYAKIRIHYSPRVLTDPDLLAKTAALVVAHVESTGVREPQALYEINAETLAALKAGQEPEPVKVFNLTKSIAATVANQAASQPYLIPIGERAEAIRAAYDDRQIDTQDALDEAARLVDEYNRIQLERAAKNFDASTFAIYLALQQSEVDDPEGPAIEINALFEAHPHWRTNAASQRALKAKLYKALLPLVGPERAPQLADKLERLQRQR